MTDWNKATQQWLHDFAPQGILVTDAELNVRGWNNWLEVHSGRRAAEVMGRNLLEVYPELVERGLDRYYRDALTGQIRILSHRFHRYLLPLPSDYRPGPMAQSAQIAPLVEAGRVIGTITVIEDVTERVERENALRESEQWLRTTLRSIGDAVIATDEKGLVTFMNSVAVALTGWDEREAVGQPLEDVFHIINEQTGEQAENPVTRVIQEGVIVGLANHTVLIARDGTKRPIADSGAPIRDGRGNIIGTVMVFRDVTEQRRAEEALRESEERLKVLFEFAPDAYYLSDLRGTFIDGNRAAEELLGYKREELIGKSFLKLKLLSPEQIPRAAALLARNVLGKPTGPDEFVLNREDGRQVPVEIRTYPVKIKGRTVVLGIARDITERKKAERAVEERRRYLEGVLGAAPDAIVTLDAHHRIVEWNPGAEKLFGYSREEAIGQNIDDLITSPDVLEEAAGLTQMVLGGREAPPTETVRYRKDGSPVDVIVAGSPILVEDEFIGVVAVYTDITARVRMEETLRALALVDELTGLYNRRGFVTLAEQQLKTAHRTKRKMLLFFADLDDMKWINDTFGHSEGDRALIETADALRETFRGSDIVARIGGDEFVVLAIATDGFPAEILTTRLQGNLEARNAREGCRYKLSLSVGIARYDPKHPCSLDELLAQADRAMYEQKRSEASHQAVQGGSLCANISAPNHGPLNHPRNGDR